jgi:hypothetical protein
MYGGGEESCATHTTVDLSISLQECIAEGAGYGLTLLLEGDTQESAP